jgi:HlyD family secretion protein
MKHSKYKTIFRAGIFLTTLFLLGCEKPELIRQGYIEGKYTYITSGVSGTLDHLFVDRGTEVKTGQLLYVLDQQPEAAELENAKKKLAEAEQTYKDMEKGSRETIIAKIEAQKAQAEADLEYSKKMYNRYLEMVKYGAIDKAAFDQSAASYKSNVKRISQIDAELAEAKLGARENALLAQKAAVDAAKATIKQVSWALEQKTKYSPVAATVFDTLFDIGEMVLAGQPVVSLLAPENVKLIFFIPEQYLSLISLGQKLKLSCDSCRQNYFATVSFISPEAEYTPPVIYSEESRAKLVYRIEAEFDIKTARFFHPGQPVQIIISLKK